MAQWQRLNQLHAVYRQQLHELYDRDSFPMDVRHYLASWVEKQQWLRAARDHDLAMVLFQVLLENLDIQHSRFVQEESFLMQHNIRRYKQNFQRFQEEPCTLAGVIHWFLEKEKEILQSAELAEQVQLLHVEQEHMETDHQNLERKMAGLKNDVQCMERTLICLEEQQDEFDFKYKTHEMEALANEAAKRDQLAVVQMLLNRVNTCRKTVLSDFTKILDRSEELKVMLVQKELVEWQRRQQRACIGAPDNTCLDHLEKWFTCVAECLFQVRKFLMKLEELMGKLSYEHDPVKAKKPILQKRVDAILTDLLKSAFVVETQPSMPQGKGPLVLRTNVQFSVKTRLLVKFPEQNHAMKVNVSMDREAPQIKGYRRFNVLGTNSKVLNMAESHSGGMVADFRHLTLKDQKSGGGGKGISEICLSITEELHIFTFDTVFELHGVMVDLQTSSLPVVIISNASQQQSAWASILWFNMLCQDTKDIYFFANCPVASWEQLGEMLSWQFLSATDRGLDHLQLEMIALKLFRKQQDYSACKITWSKFSKENAPDVGFTFWVWFDGILVMVKMYLEKLWKDNCIMGFVCKAKEKALLQKKQRGTFLLRFSESIRDGGITFSWVDYSPKGVPIVRSVRPFTRVDLSQIPFPEIIRNFQIFEDENVPNNPLIHLYPNIPKDEAFGKYYSEKTGDDSPYIKYIKTKLVFVSKEKRVEAESSVDSDMAAADGVMLESEPCGEGDDLNGDLHAMEQHLMPHPDPMLCDTVENPGEELPQLQLFDAIDLLNYPDDHFPSYGQEFPDVSLQEFAIPPMQPCGGMYQ
ncbi:signal transducer and activator of transcription 2 [Lampris incognitus]|uniref:signal transducer and activator of transcription 2 n=1 Tax=Lampris incognitus TaxID=2546036 RepID=UPI0024B520B5|nr:signal transducer and activator of transcription 2 [Lampris incognitus]XP_056131040.1 signal transducer and activator of transcription 2 [Lampris incognitus]